MHPRLLFVVPSISFTSNMPNVNITCPIVGCDYQTGDNDTAIAAQLLGIHATQHIAERNAVNVKKPDRPEAVHDMTESEWAEFCFHFEGYKKDAKIVGKDEAIRSELQQCWSKSIKTRLFQMKGAELNTISEKDLLDAIKTTCVNKISITNSSGKFSKLNFFQKMMETIFFYRYHNY